MSEYGETLNETPTESDKMDISEVSEQATPTSDQSPSDAVDNRKSNVNKVVLDNAPATMASFTPDLIRSMTLKNTTSTTTTTPPSTHNFANSSENEPEMSNGTASGVSDISEKLSESKLTLDGLDLELPPLDMYQDECVEFPSSPTHETLQSLLHPTERDSGNAGESEDEEEDTSIYRAVLSPNCQDVCLRKVDVEPVEHATLPAVVNEAEPKLGVQKRLVSPSHEDLQLPDIGGVPIIVEEFLQPSEDLDDPPSSLSDEDASSDFIFIRRDSKRLAREHLGERVIEGLFVESRHIDGVKSQKKIPVPDDVLSTLESDAKDGDTSFEDSPLKPVPSKRNCMPVPAQRAKSLGYGSLVNPPCPKPRRKYQPKPSDRSCQVILDPMALTVDAPARKIPRVNPDGSVDVEERPGSLISSQHGGHRRIRVPAYILTGANGEEDTEDGDGSSQGSSRLSDADVFSPVEDEAGLEALLSTGVDTPDELEDSILERLGDPPNAPVAPLPELSAAEEHLESRSWRHCVVQGIERRIDMKVIEPYKRVLSHGGYLSAGSHNAIIVFSACFLPDRSRVDYDYVMDNLFLYVLTTLDQLITEDYVLIYLHGATQRSCMPTFSWLKRCYHLIDRRLRKNLKGLYLVHPTFWLKTIVLMAKPFISSKFSRKLRFIDNLGELATVVPLEQASIPDHVKQFDLVVEARQLKRRRFLMWWWGRTSPDTTTVST